MGQFTEGGIPNQMTIAFTGNLAKDAELRGSEQTVLSLSVAYNTKSKQGDKWGTEVNYINVVHFGNLGKSLVANGRLQKGQPVAITGKLHQNVYQSKDGETKYDHEVIADRDDGVTVLQRATNGNGRKSEPKSEETTEAPAEQAGEPTPF